MRKTASVLVGIALAVAASASAGSMVSYPSGSETVSGYLSAPGGAGKKPGIVVIHEWWGVNDWVKGKTDEFAKQGYVAVAPEIGRASCREGVRDEAAGRQWQERR